jgi:hypothetical protein
MYNAQLDGADTKPGMFSQDYGKWLHPPKPNGFVPKIVMGLDGQSIDHLELILMWEMRIAANKYKVLAKHLSEISPAEMNNDPWHDVAEKRVTNAGNGGLLANQVCLKHEDIPSETTIFRFVAYDSFEGGGDFARMGAFNTNSVQSPFISDPIEFEQIAPDVIRVADSVGLKVNDILWADQILTCVKGTVNGLYSLAGSFEAISGIQVLSGVYVKAI